MVLRVWNLGRTRNRKSPAGNCGPEMGLTANWFRVGADDQPSTGRDDVLQEVPNETTLHRRWRVLQPGADEVESTVCDPVESGADRDAIGPVGSRRRARAATSGRISNPYGPMRLPSC